MDKGGAKAERGYPGPTRGTGSERGSKLDVQSGDSLRWGGFTDKWAQTPRRGRVGLRSQANDAGDRGVNRTRRRPGLVRVAARGRRVGRRRRRGRRYTASGYEAVEVDRHRKDDGRALFVRDLTESLQVAQLERGRWFADDVGGVLERSCRLTLTLRRNHLPTTNTHPPQSVSWSLTSPFSTNIAISETKGQGWRVIPTQWRKASNILTSTLAAFSFRCHPKMERDRDAI